MKMRPRIYYSEGQKTLMWDRWQKGESLHSIARLFDRPAAWSRVFVRATEHSTGDLAQHLAKPGSI